MAKFQMHAKSSLDGKIYPWLSDGGPDRLGSLYPGPGTPLDIAVAQRGPRLLSRTQRIQLTGLASVETIGAPTVTRSPAFPAGVTPVVWFNGNQQAYSDSGGSTPANSGLIRRLSEPSPLTGAWTTPTDPERPSRDGNSVRVECTGAAGGTQMQHPSVGGVSSAACTLVISYVARDNAFAGPVMGLLRSLDTNVGVRIASNQIWVYYNGGTNWFSPLTVTHGARNTIAVVYTSTGIQLTVNAGGVISTASLVASITASTITAAWQAGVDGAGYMYGSIVQMFVVASSLSSTQRDDAMAWAHAQAAPVAYPEASTLVAIVGDSIPRGTGANYGLTYGFLALANMRAAGRAAEVCNTAVGGTGVTGLLAPVSLNQSLFLRASAFYSAARRKNVMIIALGTNDLANGNSTAYVLHGTGAAAGSGLYPAIDAAVSQGWKVVVIVPGPRSDTPANGGTMIVSQGTYNGNRDVVCDDLVANAPSHGVFAVLDTRTLTHYGVNGDSDNGTYYSVDRIHPLNAGHALLDPVLTPILLAA